MRIHLVSDLHLEISSYSLPPDIDFDVLVAAGDISPDPREAIDFLAGVGKPVVYVLGNHDCWSDDAIDMADRLQELKDLARGTQIHVLERESVVIDGVRFLGATLWTDLGADINPVEHLPPPDVVRRATFQMNDHSYIVCERWFEDDPALKTRYLDALGQGLDEALEGANSRFDPVKQFVLNRATRDWLGKELRMTGDWTRTVVVTHHAPCVNGALDAQDFLEEHVDPRNLLAPKSRPQWEPIIHALCYAGSGRVIPVNYMHDALPHLWLHGHIHKRMSYHMSGVRVIANPRGYGFGGPNAADRHHRRELVIDLDDELAHPHRAYLKFVERFAEDAMPLFARVTTDFDGLPPAVSERLAELEIKQLEGIGMMWQQEIVRRLRRDSTPECALHRIHFPLTDVYSSAFDSIPPVPNLAAACVVMAREVEQALQKCWALVHGEDHVAH